METTFKPETITVTNYKMFKPSEFVRSFTSDIEVAEKSPKLMDMSEWEPRGGCMACLGGTAVLNFGTTWKTAQKNHENGKCDVPYLTAIIGNSIRSGDPHSAAIYLGELYGIEIPNFRVTGRNQTFCGITPKSELAALKDQVHRFADALEERGL